MNFRQWLFQQVWRDDPIGDLARDARRDLTFPFCGTYSVYWNYLTGRPCCQGALKAFRNAWREHKHPPSIKNYYGREIAYVLYYERPDGKSVIVGTYTNAKQAHLALLAAQGHNDAKCLPTKKKGRPAARVTYQLKPVGLNSFPHWVSEEDIAVAHHGFTSYEKTLTKTEKNILDGNYERGALTYFGYVTPKQCEKVKSEMKTAVTPTPTPSSGSADEKSRRSMFQ